MAVITGSLRSVPDDVYVVMPNQLGTGCSLILRMLFQLRKNICVLLICGNLLMKNHLDLSWDGVLNPRDAFGSHDDADHVYNTPRAWYHGALL